MLKQPLARSVFMLMLLGLGGILGGLAVRGIPLAAQGVQTDLRLQTVIVALVESGKPFTIQFNASVARLGYSLDIGLGGGVVVQRVGADVICFETLTQALRPIDCVPLSNVVSVFYAE
jgi:hypothetical protein